MRIGIVGLGYVGIITAAVLSEQGHRIIGVDIDKKRVEMLRKGISPIYEPGLDDLLTKGSQKEFSTDYSSLHDSEVIFIAVPTPTVRGEIDLSYVISAVKSAHNANKRAIITIKSTVTPGTAARIKKELGVSVVSNPEFIAEGAAIEGTKSPDRVVIGSDSGKPARIVESIWSFTKAPVVLTSNENAELIKYASNAFLAVKISYINEIANLCEKIPDCDVAVIAKAMGLDRRIGPHMLNAGIGFGGSCFPKDTKAIASFAKSVGEDLKIVEAAVEVNDKRVDRVMSHIKSVYGKSLKGAKIGVLGLSFKRNTDDTRESPALKLIERLKGADARICAYDPKATASIDGVVLAKTGEDCISKSDIVVIATDWDEFRGLKLNGKIVIDAKRLLAAEKSRNFRAIGLG